tara:strand:- start:474 stop:1139 length:666 start_codon:yes stop_codon:yes gene_type:complete
MPFAVGRFSATGSGCWWRTMLRLRNLADLSEFASVEKQFSRFIRSQVYSFANDKFLKRFQDVDDLYNVGLAKLHEVCCNFQYDDNLDENHNLKRFVAMLRKYVRNAMIDEQYTYNVAKRRPKGSLSSIDSAKTGDEDYGPQSLVANRLQQQSTALSQAIVNDMIQSISSELGGLDRQVFDLIVEGYPADKVAGILGMKVSKVRYIIYEKIQPRAIIYGVTI